MVILTAIERRLLFLLAENAGRILPTSRILEAVWGEEFSNQSNYVKFYIWRLRQKFELGAKRFIVKPFSLREVALAAREVMDAMETGE